MSTLPGFSPVIDRSSSTGPPFTITEGGTALASADVLVVHYKPFIIDSPDTL